MDRIFVTSDLHLNHAMLVSTGKRPFESIEGMNECIQKNWNNKVDCGDTIYNLGDVYFRRHEYPNGFRGRIVHIRGNHDKKSLSNIQNLIIEWQGQEIEMVHNPIDATGKCKIILHGHLHITGNHSLPNSKQVKPHIHIQGDYIFYNCNLEFHKYKPKALSEIIGEVLCYLKN